MAGKGLQALRTATEIANVYALCSGVAAVAAFFLQTWRFSARARNNEQYLALWNLWITK
jgi:hypothetical protein